MGQADEKVDAPPAALTEFQARLEALVLREVQAAHGDILRDLAASEMARKEAELQVSDLRQELALARQALNDLRGIRTPERSEPPGDRGSERG